MFYSLYQHDIISEEAFMMWKEDMDDSVPGKMMCLFAVNKFLDWLLTAEEESSDDEKK